MSRRNNTVRVVHWNPRSAHFGGHFGRLVAIGPRKNNFGDLLGPHIVTLIRGTSADVRPAPVPARLPRMPTDRPHLLTVGSIMHFARDGDTVWGTGLNGKVDRALHTFADLDVRAVRGPRTRAFLATFGIEAPPIYGDPALLLPYLEPEILRWRETKAHSVAVVPNLNDAEEWRWHGEFVDPRAPLEVVIRRIAQSERVVASSLHGFIVAEALGIPATLVRSQSETELKYRDYVEGTGRSEVTLHESLGRALAAEPAPPTLDWDPQPLLAAFPRDLWQVDSHDRLK